jgi:putative transposase
MKMTQIKLNVNDEILHGLFTQNDQGVAKLLERVLNLVLRAQATEQLKAEPYERMTLVGTTETVFTRIS